MSFSLMLSRFGPVRRASPLLVLVLIGLGADAGAASSLPASVPPGVAEQLRNMPPDQARELARQYGIDIDTLLGDSGSGRFDPIGEAGDDIVPSVPRFPEDRRRERSRDQERDRDVDAPIEPLDPAERYGLDFFSGEVSTFAPVDNIPVPADYRLGPGDSLNVLLVGRDSRELSLQVDRSGEVAFPELGKIAIGAMTLEDASQAIRERVANQLIGVEAIVGVGRLRAINIMLAGEVRVPGARSLSAFARVSHALYAAGGLTEIGSLRRIEVKRGGATVATFDAYDLLLDGSAVDDIRLREGDVVFVPPVREIAEVRGLVRRPAVYELVNGETLAELVAMGGGLTARAFGREAVLERQETGGIPRIRSVPFDDASLASITVRDGDRLRVQAAADRYGNRIILRGAVQRPGVYGHRDGMRVSDLISDPDSDLAKAVDLDYALVVSTDGQSGAVSVRPFSLREMLARPDTDADPPLASRDEVIIFANIASEVAQRKQREDEELQAFRDQEQGALSGNRSGQPGATDQDSVERERRNRFSAFPRATDNPMANGALLGATAGFGASGRAVGRRPEIDPSGIRTDRERGLRDERAEERSPSEEREVPTRQELLAPIIARLEAQASPQRPVQVVEVSGAVHAPGEYPLGDGDTVAELLAAAGGLRDDAFVRDLELQRVVIDTSGNASIRTLSVDLANDPQEGRATELGSRDLLMVRAVPDWRPDDMVVLSGEVRFPGEYRIGPGETLGDVLRRAGGVTADGFAEGAVFTRDSLAEQEQRETERFVQELRRSAAVSTLTLENSSTDVQGLQLLVEALRSAPNRGRMVVDIPRILLGDESADFVLQDGDEIEVPPSVNTVTIVGEVQRPGSYRFQENFDIDDYIALSAGTNRRADEGRMYVLHANGEVSPLEGLSWFRFDLSSNDIEPGDTIVVPIDTSYRNTLDYWSSVTQIAYQTGIALAALVRF